MHSPRNKCYLPVLKISLSFTALPHDFCFQNFGGKIQAHEISSLASSKAKLPARCPV